MAWRLAADPEVSAVVCAPGNPGMAALAACHQVAPTDVAGILALVKQERIDLTVVGPEAALDAGVADALSAQGHPVVGPSQRASALETSKVFSKDFMARAGIPTARFVVCRHEAEALAAVAGETFGFPVVVKADGLAGGKGVVVASTREEAEAAVRACMVDRQFGDAGQTLVIEECLTGPEVSFFVLADGHRAIPLGTAQDHKRAFDDDRGPNTGGMGAFAPSRLMTPALQTEVMTSIVAPVLREMAGMGGYRGFLYVSLMLTAEGPKVIEFNVRFGDPETQVVWPLLEGPLARTLLAAAHGNLDGMSLAVAPRSCVGVVMAAQGYPMSPVVGQPIAGLDDASRMGVTVFHAGTTMRDNRLVTSGGRVLTVVGQAETPGAAMAHAYQGVQCIRFDGMHYRSDIGRRA